MAKKRWKRWIVYGLIILTMIVLSGVLGQIIAPHLKGWEELGYVGLFSGALFANALILFPAPFFSFLGPLAIGLAQQNGTIWGYIGVASIYAVAAAIGESTSYFVGRRGRKILGNGAKNDKNKIPIVSWLQEGINEDIQTLGLEKRIRRWLKKYGGLMIFVLAFLPFLPFDVAGIIAGNARYPYWKFLVFCFLGRVPKYLFMLVTGFEGWEFFKKLF